MRSVPLGATGQAFAYGDPDASAGVVVLPEVFGADGALAEYAQRLSSRYAVLAVDYWARTPIPSLQSGEEITAAVATIDDGQVLRDISLARQHFGSRPVGVIGFCLGGLYARLACVVVPGFAAAVEFYGRIVYPTLTDQKPTQPLDLLFGRTCPLLAHFGTIDPVAPEVHVDELERRLGRQEAWARVLRYPHCGHAFMNSRRSTFNADAARTAWQRTERFFDERLMAHAPA